MATPIPQNRAQFTLGELALATSGKVIGDARTEVVGVCTDSRRISGGELFVALQGENFDGHDHVRSAFEKGAAAVAISRTVSGIEGCAQLRVDDTLVALGDIASTHRERWSGSLVAITGSVGKTTTKSIVREVLERFGKTHATRGNLNNLIGVPMTLLGLGDHDYAVVELGTNAPGEIAQLAAMCRPDVGVVTAVALSHSEGLGGLEKIADEKADLIRALAPEATSITDGDSELLQERVASFEGNKLTVGYGGSCSVHIAKSELTDEGTTHVRYEMAGESREAELTILGEAGARAAGVALAVAKALRLSPEVSLAAAAKCEPEIGRLVMKSGARGRLILDDSYNANPASMRASIDAAAELAERGQRRLVLVLGDMLELGNESPAAHAHLGAYAAARTPHALVTVGPFSIGTATAAARIGRVYPAVNVGDALVGLQRFLSEDEVVLVKGSRGVALDELVDLLSMESQP